MLLSASRLPVSVSVISGYDQGCQERIRHIYLVSLQPLPYNNIIIIIMDAKDKAFLLIASPYNYTELQYLTTPSIALLRYIDSM